MINEAISDVHTHNRSSNTGIIALEPRDARFTPGLVYSLGIHPWSVPDASEEDLRLFETLVTDPQVVAIGESGLDRLRGGDIQKQTVYFLHHIRLSEELEKPLIIHNVRCLSELIGLRRNSCSVQPWIFHGFRGNERKARQLTDAGIYLSFGEKFTAGVPQSIPPEMILVETDMSATPIFSISAAVCPDDPDLPRRNLQRIFSTL